MLGQDPLSDMREGQDDARFGNSPCFSSDAYAAGYHSQKALDDPMPLGIVQASLDQDRAMHDAMFGNVPLGTSDDYLSRFHETRFTLRNDDGF